ncbi:isochorismate synthase [Streptomyces prunicolor]|uniref:isochorismate synthase n=1 Tax=Streptomyces prunicolor TaxID=67348 RepID=UPI003723A6B1
MSAPGNQLPDRLVPAATEWPRASYRFVSPNGTAIAADTHLSVPDPVRGTDPVGAIVERLRAGAQGTVAVGLLPFRAGAPVRVSVTAKPRASREPTASGSPPAPAGGMRVKLCSVQPEPAEVHYVAAVEEALRRLGSGRLDKVVLARTLHLTAESPVSVHELLASLRRGNPHAYVFAAPLAAGRTLVGASPELLVAKEGGNVVSHPLAGTTPRSADPDEDARRAGALLRSAKDLREHALVVDAVAAALRPYCRRLRVPARPSLTRTATLWHLGTRVRGVLRDPATSSLALAAALHPTPAVCGTPTDAARDLIGELEPFDRGYYAGTVGWCNTAGDGEWAVAIRCAEVEDRSLRLFSGAGIVPGSSPQGELAETAAKFGTLLDALGLDKRALALARARPTST